MFGINTVYDDPESGEYQYKKLRHKLDTSIQRSKQAKATQDEDSDGGADNAKAKKLGQEVPLDENPVNEIHRGRAGIIMPQKNAFDFIEKPRTNEGYD